MKKIINILLLLVSVSSFAQQDAMFNQYIFNELIINPAYAGTKGMLNINAIYSSQWTGFPGAPITQSLSLEGPASKTVGLGLHIINDHIGAQGQQGAFSSYSYKIKIDDVYKLSFGLAFGLSYFTIDGNKLTSDIQDDPAIPKTFKSKLLLDAKFGTFIYSEKFYTGFSVNNLLTSIKESYDLLVPVQSKHVYLTSGYVFDINPKLKLKPSIFFKTDFKAQSNFDISSNFLINYKLWLGASVKFGYNIFNNKSLDNSLKHSAAIIFMTEYNITDKFIVGYAYTLSTSVLKKYPGHEFVIGYYFPQKIATKMVTPRYF
ncbi:MAG: type IX secretion system membrane protein PorP/SprF [Bacteroidetes bacterium]|nr:type IX secretion system membrane protein PorP/SprF [Bacteroidota bacterium]